MRIIKLKLKNRRSYDIIIGNNTAASLGRHIRALKIGDSAYIITNPLIKNKYAPALIKALKRYGLGFKFKLVPDSEKSKSIEAAGRIIKDIAAFDKKRNTFIIAFGGGVIGDLSGFVASVYKRGIPYIQVPTTLLAQVDSSIGGKTAVDLSVGKNLIGAFYQPRLVLSDIRFLKSLGLRQIQSGLAEVIKYALIKDPKLFAYLEKKHKDALCLKEASLEFIVASCSNIKAGIVSRDEKEGKGIRTILNFGHTIGHAIEAAGGFNKYNHGEAVALGMLVASDISSQLGLLNRQAPQRIEKLIRSVGLPVTIRKIPLSAIIKAHYHDKKFIGAKNRFVLIRGLGKTKILENIPLEVIRRALERRIPG